MAKVSSYFHTIKKLNTYIIILTITVVIIIAILIINHITGKEVNYYELGTNAFYNIIGALIAILIFDVWHNHKTDTEHDRYIMESIWKLLKAEKENSNNSIINSMYDEASVGTVMQNCLQHYCNDLSSAFYNYIKQNRDIFRTDFKYNVGVKSNGEIEQSLSYCRHFRINELRPKFSFKCYFALREGALERMMNISHFFFREEIEDSEVIAQLRQCKDDPVKVMELLEFSMALGKDKSHSKPVPAENIIMDFDDDGITFKVMFDEQNFIFTPLGDGNSTSGYVSYYGKIHCKFKGGNRFYCIFSEPCVKPSFTINFPDTLPLTKVNRVTCLTIPEKDVIQVDTTTNSIKLTPTDDTTVFPRSGIYFTW